MGMERPAGILLVSLHCLHQAEIALAYQIEERLMGPCGPRFRCLFRHCNHEPQMSPDDLAPGLSITAFGFLEQPAQFIIRKLRQFTERSKILVEVIIRTRH